MWFTKLFKRLSYRSWDLSRPQQLFRLSRVILNTEQINHVSLLLGVIEQMGIRELIDAHLRPHGAWQEASVGTVVSIWLYHVLAERNHRLVAVRDWVTQRATTFNLLDLVTCPELRPTSLLLDPDAARSVRVTLICPRGSEPESSVAGAVCPPILVAQ